MGKGVNRNGSGTGARFCADVQEPLFEFPAQLAGDIDAPHLVALGINILMPPVNVLNLKCNQLADPTPVAVIRRTMK